MNIFNFKQDVLLYVVHDGNQYTIDIDSISFGQTFTEHSYSNKTVQTQNMFEQSVINKANPANFEITFNAIRETDFRILFSRALTVEDKLITPFDLYIETDIDVYKLETCLITEVNFLFDKLKTLRFALTGEAAKLTREGAAGIVTIPGTPVARTTSTYNRVGYISIVLDSVELSGALFDIKVNLTNNIDWIAYTTAGKAVDVQDYTDTMYPSQYVVNNKELTGSFIRGATEDFFWAQNKSLFIRVGELSGATFYGIEFDIPEVTYSKITRTGDIFTQSFAWKMNTNPTSLAEVIIYRNTVEASGSLLDSSGQSLLDSSGNPLLESP